jgi:hypothetical protein
MLPPKRRAGQPTSDASGRTSFDEICATPTKSASTPRPSDASRGPVARPWAKSP